MNLEQVARRARVSTATVSRVINNADVVKSSTRLRVMQAIEELKYHPNLHARSLAGGKSRAIGVIVSNLENPFFFDIYKTIEATARQRGFEVVMANTDYRPEQLVASVRLMLGRRVAGLAAIVSEIDSGLVQDLSDSRIPVVFYDVGAPGRNLTVIRVKYALGMEKVVTHLYDLGHRRIGFIGHHSMLGPLNERMRSVLDAVARFPGLEVQTAADADTLDGGRQAARALLSAGPALTAMVCVNDITAVGALLALREAGLRVPEDVSVTGFDDVKLAAYSYPALTTVHVPRDRIGAIICERLLPEDGAAEAPGQELVIEPELIVRASTGPVRQSL